MEKLDKKFKNEKLGLELDIYKDETGKEWFKAQDVSEFLGYRMASDMTRLITFDENVTTHIMRTGVNNTSTVAMINEMAIYEIVCKITKADANRYEKAREFQRWVFGEVLPEIRKHGAYILADDEKQAYERAIAGYKSAIERLEAARRVSSEFSAARGRTIDLLNSRVEDAEYNRDELILCCNDLRFIIGKMFVKRNNLDIDVESIPVTRQEEIFDQVALEYPELKDTWYKVIAILRGEEV